VGFIATGKTFDAVKETVAAIAEAEWKEYANEQQVWSYARFEYQCEKWKRGTGLCTPARSATAPVGWK
jgi:hypothetical protein